MPFFVKQNDTSPALQVTLYQKENGDVVNLSGSSVVFNMRGVTSSNVAVSRQPCDIVDATSGVVKYEWQAADTQTTGKFWGEFEVTYSDGAVETFPNKGYLMIIVGDDVA